MAEGLESRVLLTDLFSQQPSALPHVVLFDADYFGADDDVAAWVEDASHDLGRSAKPDFVFAQVASGVSLKLTPAEADLIFGMEGVVQVLADEALQLQKNSALEVGAQPVWDGTVSGGITGTSGAGTIIGIIDSGIDFDLPSFAAVGPDDGYQHVNPFGDGQYLGLGDPDNPDYDPTLIFNDKLIGAWDFTEDTPIDSAAFADHGTSVAAIAAGNFVTTTIPNSTETTQISGVAPHANIIVYDVCDSTDNCSSSAILSAVDQAIVDGVDVINMSIGGSSSSPWLGVMATAMQRAHEAGIFVAVSAGNDGPEPGTITAPAEAPWLASVASASETDVRRSIVSVVGTDVPAELQAIAAVPGQDISLTQSVGPLPAIHVADVAPGDPLGSSEMAAGSLSGRIALIDRGSSLFETKVQNAFAAGASGVVMINNIGGSSVVMAGVDGVPIPSVMISREDGQQLRQWLRSNPNARLQIDAFETETADIVPSFSARGSNPFSDTLTPSLAATGNDFSVIAPVATTGVDEFEYFSGTSAASPHVAGAAALLTSLYPDWSPSEILSALQLTADNEAVTGLNRAAATPFDVGAGVLNVAAAAETGIVLQETAINFELADPTISGDSSQLNLAAFVENDATAAKTWTRSLRSVAASNVSWTATWQADAGLTLQVPSSTTIVAGESAGFEVSAAFDETTVNPEQLQRQNGWLFGRITLTPDSQFSSASFPVALRVPQPAQVLLEESGSGTNVSEAGAGDQYDLRLTNSPSSSVTIRVTADDGLRVGLNESTANAFVDVVLTDDSPTTVFVTAENDDTTAEHRFASITHQVITSADPDYPASTVVPSLQVSIFDDEAELLDPTATSPTITSPLGRVRGDISLQWEPVDNAVAYDVQLFRLNETAPLQTSRITQSTLEAGSLELGRYWFQVRAQFDGRFSNWESSNFAVDVVPAINPLPYFADDLLPTVTWDAVPGAARYEIFVTNQTADQPGLFVDADIATNSWQPPRALSFGLHRFWVRAHSADGLASSWSNAAEYYVGAQPDNLIASSFDSRPVLAWTRPQGTTSVDLYIRHPDASVTIERAISSSSFQPDQPLADGHHFWWVRPANGDQIGLWSQRAEIFVGGRPLQLGSEESNIAESILLTWHPVNGAAEYEIFLRNNSTGEVVNSRGIANNEFQTALLSVDDYIFWVRAFDDEGNAGYWSRPAEFTVAPAEWSATVQQPDRIVTFQAEVPLTWSATADAVAYDVYLTDGISVVSQFDIQATQFTTPTLSSDRSWQWWVRPVNGFGQKGRWTNATEIDLSGRPDGLMVNLNNGVTFSWQPVIGATRYLLQVDDVTRGTSAIIRENDLTDTSYTSQLQSGRYRFWVKAINPTTNAGLWSRAFEFEV